MKRLYTKRDLQKAVDVGYRRGYDEAVLVEGRNGREQQALAALSAALDALMHFAEFAATPLGGKKVQ